MGSRFPGHLCCEQRHLNTCRKRGGGRRGCGLSRLSTGSLQGRPGAPFLGGTRGDWPLARASGNLQLKGPAPPFDWLRAGWVIIQIASGF